MIDEPIISSDESGLIATLQDEALCGSLNCYSRGNDGSIIGYVSAFAREALQIVPGTVPKKRSAA